jgi:hypothetical protein
MLMVILTLIAIAAIVAVTLIIATYIDERNTPHL